MVSGISHTVSQSTSHSYQGSMEDPPSTYYIESKDAIVSSEKPTTTTTKTSLSSNLVAFSRFLREPRIEIFTFIFNFSYFFTRIMSTSMILDKVCLAHYDYPPEICNNLQNHTEIKNSIERLSTNYQLGYTLIHIVPAAFLSCFVGPWSDRYGRKLPLLIAIAGITLNTLGSAVCAHYLDSRVEYYYIPAAFFGLSGGTVSLLAVTYSYASDLTNFEKRTVQYALIEIFAGFAQALGAASGGWTYSFFGYAPVFLISTVGLLCSFIYAAVLFPETRGKDNKDSWETKLRNMFSFQTFKESFVATVKKRPNKGRMQTVLLIISMCFIMVSVTSTSDITYLYVHHQFDWGPTEYSSITALYSVVGIVVLLVVVPLFKRFKTGDPTLGLVGTTSIVLKFLGIGLAFKEIIFHIANILGLLSTCAALAARSHVSKVVSKDDLGKVFSFVASAESLLPILTTILISQIFNVFLTIFPGMPYIVLTVLLLMPFSVFVWLMCLPPLTSTDPNNKEEESKESYTHIDP